MFRVLSQASKYLVEVSLPRGNEGWEFLQLGQTHCCLWIGELEIVTDFGVVIAMIVVARHARHFSFKANAALAVRGAVIAAPAIPAPITYRTCDFCQARPVRVYGATLPKRIFKKFFGSSKAIAAESVADAPAAENAPSEKSAPAS